MGYPLRWEQVAIPEACEEAVLQQPPAAPGHRRYYVRLAVLAFACVAVMVATVIGVSSMALSDGRPPLRLEPVAAGSAISAATPKALRRVGFVQITGSITNRKSRALDTVEAVVDLLDDEQRTLRSQSAMVALDPVAPGYAAGYRVEMQDDAKAVAYRVHFRHLYGADVY